MRGGVNLVFFLSPTIICKGIWVGIHLISNIVHGVYWSFKDINWGITAQFHAVSVYEKQIIEHFNIEISKTWCSIDACKWEVSFVFGLQSLMEWIIYAKQVIIGNFICCICNQCSKSKSAVTFCFRDRILVYDKLGVHPLQNGCFSQNKVPVVRVLIEVEVLLVVSN